MSTDEEDQQTYEEFSRAVNMTRTELEKWLDTDEAKEVGQKMDGGESTGHRSRRRIVKLLQTAEAELTTDDYAHMRKVTGYVSRHLAQRPKGDPTETSWRYSLTGLPSWCWRSQMERRCTRGATRSSPCSLDAADVHHEICEIWCCLGRADRRQG